MRLLGTWGKYRLVEGVISLRNVKSGISVKEVERSKVNVVDFDRHNREVLCTRNVCECHSSPDDNIVVSHRIDSVGPFAYTFIYLRLVGELTCCEEFVVTVLGNPDLLRSIVSSLRVEGVFISD